MSKKVSGKTHTQKQLDDYANQNNPNSKAYRARMDNHANQVSEEKRKERENYATAMSLLYEIGVPFAPDGTPLGIGWDD